MSLDLAVTIMAYEELYGSAHSIHGARCAIDLVNLRGFIRDRTGAKVTGRQLVKPLNDLGYRREGYRPIDTCPGKSLFFTKG